MHRLLALILWFLSPGVALASAPALWGGLAPGPHAVGYRGAYELDASRTFFPEATFEGRRLEGDRRRPVPVRLWYPARPTAAAPMTYGQYRRIEGATPRLREFADRWDQRSAGIHQYAARKYQSQGGVLDRLFASPMLARKGAAPLPGPFPLIAYGGGAGFSADENVALWEHLASHGYIVAVVPAQGPQGVGFSADARGLETLARDMEFALGRARAFESADSDRTAAMGFSYGGLAALLVASRNTDIDAVVGFDSSITSTEYSRPLLANPTYDPAQVTAPVLEFHRADRTVTRSVLDALRYSDRRSFEIEGPDHVDFVNYPLVFHVLGGRSAAAPGLETRRGWYEAMVRRTLDFLEATLKGDAAAAARLDRPLTAVGAAPIRPIRKAGLARPPTSTELLEVFAARGPVEGDRLVASLAGRDPQAPALSRNSMNRLGYALLERNAPAAAVSVFRWNVGRHPRSPGLYDSLADGFAATGQATCAAAAYVRVLQLLDAGAGAEPDNPEDLRATATRRLRELPPPAAGCPGL